jgi:hypothetical protein
MAAAAGEKPRARWLWPRVAPLQHNRLPRMNLTVLRIPLLTPQMPSLKKRNHVPVDFLSIPAATSQDISPAPFRALQADEEIHARCEV